MKPRYCLIWLSVVLVIGTVEARAGMVLNPIAGIARTTYFGEIYVDDYTSGPPGIIGYEYENRMNGGILGLTDPRSMQGFDNDSLLLYDLRTLHGSELNQAMLTMAVDQALNNFSPDFYFSVYLQIRVFGYDRGTLSPEAYETMVPISWKGLSIPSGYYPGPRMFSLDLTAVVANLLGRGFDYSTVLFQTFAETVSGGSSVRFARPPVVSINGGVEAQAIPEASSIVQVGLSVVGFLLYTLFGRTRRGSAAAVPATI